MVKGGDSFSFDFIADLDPSESDAEEDVDL